MWLKTEYRMIDLAEVVEIQLASSGVVFLYKDKNYSTIAKNSPEAAQALFEHVAALLGAKE